MGDTLLKEKEKKPETGQAERDLTTLQQGDPVPLQDAGNAAETEEEQAVQPLQDAGNTNTALPGEAAANTGMSGVSAAAAQDLQEQEKSEDTGTGVEEEQDESKEAGNGAETAQDEVNRELLKTMEKVSGAEGGKGKKDEGEQEDPYFDKLPVKWKESNSKPIETDAMAQEIKAKIGKLRESGLYQAVVVSRLLKQNKSNPVAAGMLSRAMNASAWNYAADLNAGVTGFTGLLSTFDKNAKSQTVYQGISLVTNMVTVITSIKNIFQKVKGLQFKNTVDAWIGNLFLGIGIIGDFALAFAKSVAIAKTIASFAKKDLPILKKISNWMFLATGTSQAIALMNTSRALYKGWSGIQKLETAKAGLWAKAKLAVHAALGTGSGAKAALQAGNAGMETESESTAPAAEQQTEGESAAPAAEQQTEGESAAPAAEQQKAPAGQAPLTEKEKKKRMAELKKKDSRKSETRLIKAQKALQAIEQRDGTEEAVPGQGVLEESKDDLIKYIGLSKRIKKQKHDEAALLASAINVTMGLGTSIISGGKFVAGQGAARTGKDSWKTANQVLGYVSAGAGLLTNSAAVVSSGIRIGSRFTNRKDDRSEAVKERLFQKIDQLGQDERGLKYLENSLADLYAAPNDDSQMTDDEKKIIADRQAGILTQADETAQMYGNTADLLQTMGTPVGKLSGAKNLKEFKKILVSGLV